MNEVMMKKTIWVGLILLLSAGAYVTFLVSDRLLVVENFEERARQIVTRTNGGVSGNTSVESEEVGTVGLKAEGNVRQDKRQIHGGADAGKAALARIEKRYMFSPPPPQGFRSIAGVLGDRVFFRSGQDVEVGGQFGGATVKAIGSDWVELEHEGQTIRIGVFGGQGSYEREKTKKEAAVASSDKVKTNDDQGAVSTDEKPSANELPVQKIDDVKVLGRQGAKVRM